MTATNDPSREPVDGLDLAVLDRLATMYEMGDPMPTGLVERSQFAVALHELEAEVAAILVTEERAQPAGAHNIPVGARNISDQARSITFATSTTTVSLLTGQARPDGRRLDGWVVAEEECDSLVARLRLVGTTVEAAVSQEGRFEFRDVPTGMAQLMLVTADDTREVLVTPTFEL